MLNDINLERQLCSILLRDMNKLSVVISADLLTNDHFSDLALRRIFKVLKAYYLRYFKKPTKRMIKISLSKRIKDEDVELYNILIDKLYKLDLKKLQENFQAMIDNAEELRKAREIQKTVIRIGSKFETNDVAGAIEEFSKARDKISLIAGKIDEGEFAEDFEERKALVIQRRDNPEEFSPVPCALPILQGDNPYSAVQIYLDEILNGGWYNGRLYLVVGNSNSGKSVMLMEAAFQAAMAGKIAILFTIEMMKQEQQFRIDSRISGIDFSKFERGNLTEAEIEKWGKRVDEFKKRGGALYVVGFPKGCTVANIEAKMLELKQKFGRIDFVAIDYLNDMTPRGKYVNTRDWTAIGEISWDMKQLAQYFNDNKGVPILTANQGKKSDRGAEVMTEKSVAFSPLPHQHSAWVLMLKEELDDEGNLKYITGRVDKDRFGKKYVTFYMVPKFEVMQISTRVEWDVEDF